MEVLRGYVLADAHAKLFGALWLVVEPRFSVLRRPLRLFSRRRSPGVGLLGERGIHLGIDVGKRVHKDGGAKKRHRLERPVVLVRRQRLDARERVEPADDGSEDGVLPIQVRSRLEGEKELGRA